MHQQTPILDVGQHFKEFIYIRKPPFYMSYLTAFVKLQRFLRDILRLAWMQYKWELESACKHRKERFKRLNEWPVLIWPQAPITGNPFPAIRLRNEMLMPKSQALHSDKIPVQKFCQQEALYPYTRRMAPNMHHNSFRISFPSVPTSK